MKTNTIQYVKTMFMASVAGCFIFGGSVAAQEVITPRLNYYQQELYVNPAFAGSQGFFSSSLAVEKSWAGFTGAPNIQRLQANAPLSNEKVGLGITFENQNYTPRNQINANAVYAYRVAMKQGTWSFGLNAGFTSIVNRYSSIYTPDPTDPQFAANSDQLWGFNLGIGTYYHTDKFYIGLSLPQLIDNSVKEGVENELVGKLDLSKAPVYVTGGYVFDLSQDFKLKPAAMLYYSGYNNFKYNLSATAFLRDKYWLGAFVRSKNQIGATIGLSLLDYLTVSYAFDVSYGDPYTYRGMTHQVVIGFIWNKDSRKLKLNLF